MRIDARPRAIPLYALAVAALLVGCRGTEVAPHEAACAPVSPGTTVVKDVPAMTVLARRERITLSQVSEAADRAIPALEKALAEAHLTRNGSLCLLYSGCDGSADKPFDFAVAFPIALAEGHVAPAGFAIESLPPYHCAAVGHAGSMSDCKATYATTYRKMFFSGHKSTGENREVYSHWEGFTSPKTECEIQVGIK